MTAFGKYCTIIDNVLWRRSQNYVQALAAWKLSPIIESWQSIIGASLKQINYTPSTSVMLRGGGQHLRRTLKPWIPLIWTPCYVNEIFRDQSVATKFCLLIKKAVVRTIMELVRAQNWWTGPLSSCYGLSFSEEGSKRQNYNNNNNIKNQWHCATWSPPVSGQKSRVLSICAHTRLVT